MNPQPPSPDRPGVAGTAVFAAIAAVLCGGLLWRLVFLGRTQSFDTMLYARGLWGLAHGDWSNPVLGVPTPALHAHLLAWGLAPLTWALPAAAVLVIAQAGALGATWFLTLRETCRVLGPGWGLVAGIAAMTSPLVLNPFFFDPRPDLLGVPLLTAASLRAARRGGFDGPAFVLLALAALAREEFALAGAAALALAPPSADPALWKLGRRLVAAAGLAAWFAAYTFALRPWLGGTEQSAALHLGGANAAVPSLLDAKLDLLAAMALTAGALPWIGWRWLGGAVPGFLFLLATRWQVEGQVHFHYPMLVAPALLAATVAGLSRVALLAAGRRSAILAGACLVACASYVRWSAAPGGRNFARFNFEMAAKDGSLAVARGENTDKAHVALARIPAHHGIAVPWQLGAPLADRPFVWAVPTLLENLGRTQRVPDVVTTVALIGDDRLRAGAVLAQAHGFRLAGPPGPAVLLTRDPAFQQVPWDMFGMRGRPPICDDAPIASWPAAGLLLCESSGDYAVPSAVVFREHAPPQAEHVNVRLLAEFQSGRKVEMSIADGLVRVSDLPVGRAAIVSGQPQDARLGTPRRFALVDGNGRELTADPAADTPRP